MPLARYYPLRGMPDQRKVWAWISFDVANQSFTLIINTLLFSIFFKEVVVRDKSRDDTLWSLLFAVSMLLVVGASPIAGAIADGRSAKKAWLVTTGLICAALTCALALVGPGSLWLAVLLYVPANFCFNIGENFLASFLPQLARREELGRVSGFSWGVAYSSALLMLVLTGGAMMLFKLESPIHWRPFFVAAGLWFAVFTLPTIFFLREDKSPAMDTGNALAVGIRRLARSAREVSRFRDLAMLLIASFFYGGAMSVVVVFAGILADNFGFKEAQLAGFVAVITVSGVLGTLLPTLIQDRLGHKRTTLILLTLWLFTTLYLAWIARAHATASPGASLPSWPVWLAGNLLGFGLGSLGSANRAFVGFLTPPSRSAEFFGIWGLVFKAAAVLVIPFGVVMDMLGMTASFLALSGMVVAGILATLVVNEHRGAMTATEDRPAKDRLPGTPADSVVS